MPGKKSCATIEDTSATSATDTSTDLAVATSAASQTSQQHNTLYITADTVQKFNRLPSHVLRRGYDTESGPFTYMSSVGLRHYDETQIKQLFSQHQQIDNTYDAVQLRVIELKEDAVNLTPAQAHRRLLIKQWWTTHSPSQVDAALGHYRTIDYIQWGKWGEETPCDEKFIKFAKDFAPRLSQRIKTASTTHQHTCQTSTTAAG